MTTTDSRRPNFGRVRQPWQDEITRLSWLEGKFARLAGDLRYTARELRGKIVPASDDAALAELDARAAELDGVAGTIDHLIEASHAGPPTAGDLAWAAWHVEELGRHLAAAAAAGVERAGSPE
jgi:hypothetical protein